MPTYKTKAIVLKRRNQGESDRVLTLFSLEQGRLSVIAKGARKSKSKLSGGIELFTEANFTLTNGKAFEILRESAPISHFLSDETDLEKIKLAYFFAEVVIHTTVENQRSTLLYQTLSDCLSQIGRVDSRLVLVYFTSKVLEVSGAYPELSVCVGCREKPTGKIRFSHSAGGIFCDKCKPFTESLFPINRNTVKLWRYILETNPVGLERLKIEDPGLLDDSSRLAQTFLCNITGKEYCTLDRLRLTE